MNAVIREATAVTPALVEGIAALVPQLSSTARPPTRRELEEIVASPATVLLVASDGPAVVGALTLVLVRIPTGLRAIIEDVVVDRSRRGQGIGEALTLEALERARAAGARSVDLTSRPSREAANRLYERLGFVRRDSNVYRYPLE
jgi:ribosomal protein S18 acetylase RimI-like enzyme